MSRGSEASSRERWLWRLDDAWRRAADGIPGRAVRRLFPRLHATLRTGRRERALEALRAEQRTVEISGQQGASRRLERLRRRLPGSLELALAHAELAMRALEWDLAVERWQSILRIHGRRVPLEAHARLATALTMRGDLDRAEAVLTEALEVVADERLDRAPGGEGRAAARRSIRFATAALHLERGDLAEAETAWRRLLADPELAAVERRVVLSVLMTTLRRAGRPLDSSLDPESIIERDHHHRYAPSSRALPPHQDPGGSGSTNWSIVIPFGDLADEDRAARALEATIGSVTPPLGSHVRVLIVPTSMRGAEVAGSVLARIEASSADDGGRRRAELHPPGLNEGPIGTVEALLQASGGITGSQAMLLVPGDRLEPDALMLLQAGMDSEDVTLAYADEDGARPDGRHVRPLLKPGPDPDLLLSQPYIGRAVAMRTAALVDAITAVAAPAPPVGLDVDQVRLLINWAAALDAASSARVPVVVLHTGAPVRHSAHGSALPPHRAFDDPESRATAVRLVSAHVRDRGAPVQISGGTDGPLRVAWPAASNLTPDPDVSIVIPTRDRAELLRACVLGMDRTLPSDLQVEIVIVDNGTVEADAVDLLDRLSGRPDTVVVRSPGPFNYSRLVNLGVDAASGDVVILLNNDVVAGSAGWVEELVGHARRPEVGAVGALLSYPDGAVQHAGVIVGFNGIAEHAFREWRSTADGYLGLLRSTRRVSAVTGACMAIRRGVFLEAGGLDEGSLPVELNDIDLCLRLNRTGLITIWTPHAHLVHLESASRGAAPSAARSRAVEQQRSAFLGRWRTTIEDDAAYHPMLVREGIPYLLGDG